MSEEQLDKPYNATFYSQHFEGMTRSAKEVLDLLYKLYQPASVIDVGCGRGAWLAVAESLGSTKLKGIDGHWVKKEDLISSNIDFGPVDFEKAIPEIGEKYELCISLEVAEHISEGNARQYIDTLCKASDIVLFSAAITHQGGAHHVNEQWQSYWIDLFNSNGYECFDLFRATLWNNKSVEWWYRQNIFLFVHPRNRFLNLEVLRASQKPVMDVAHPLNYENKVNDYMSQIEYPTLRFCLSCIKRYVRNRVMRMFN